MLFLNCFDQKDSFANLLALFCFSWLWKQSECPLPQNCFCQTRVHTMCKVNAKQNLNLFFLGFFTRKIPVPLFFFFFYFIARTKWKDSSTTESYRNCLPFYGGTAIAHLTRNTHLTLLNHHTEWWSVKRIQGSTEMHLYIKIICLKCTTAKNFTSSHKITFCTIQNFLSIKFQFTEHSLLEKNISSISLHSNEHRTQCRVFYSPTGLDVYGSVTLLYITSKTFKLISSNNN